MDATARTCLPVETVEQILEHAWKSTASAAERKALFTTFTAADSALLDLLTHIAMRLVILDVSGFSTEDIDLYAQWSCRMTDAATGAESSCPKFDQYYNLEIPTAALLAFRRDLFKNSHLRIEVLTGASAQAHRHRPRAISCRDPATALRRTWGYVLTKLTHVVPDARAVTLAPAPARGTAWPVVEPTVPALVFPTLRAFPSLRSLHLAVFFEVVRRGTQSAAPPALPQVTALRLAQVPVCECPTATGTGTAHRDWRALRADGHFECCLAATLLEGFPNLRRLHIENPVFLKTVRPPAGMETLVLDARPLSEIVGREACSSLVGYNVGAAVRRGFMSACTGGGGGESDGDGDGARGRRRIVVLAGVEEPCGWAGAKAACDEVGIELVRVVEYVARANPTRRAVRSTAVGSVHKSLTVLESARMMEVEV